MGKHARDNNDPAQKAKAFDELDEVYTRKGEEREANRYRVVDSNSKDGEGCAIAGLALLSGLSIIGYAAARAKGIA
ncbi:hypothetical protein PP459_gp054 [Streptomyces phage Wakanda]|uniref:Uncharacterized protein n=2 Tax=Wakandavirus TaxID=3044854 RepID=A0A6G8R3G1_9CAUD|nr:hypothetical protein PP459_gp054 [Streptomyces phage Wakanda]YP_010652501.1 hypothetical protein PP460_gp057 [Streptomyces phage Muntaha]QIN94179.1 hypothetical protein SEA_WAKANDA_218 [Streptomyces phage Wakanda]QIN94745.1 hypothetical protein SEA_MUNTAHA_221 [Streptomyces phage Muntaha]